MIASGRPSLSRRLAAESIGAMLLVTAVVGSGIMTTRLSPNDVWLQLLENSIATMLTLSVLIVGALIGVLAVAGLYPHRAGVTTGRATIEPSADNALPRSDP